MKLNQAKGKKGPQKKETILKDASEYRNTMDTLSKVPWMKNEYKDRILRTIQQCLTAMRAMGVVSQIPF